MTNTKTNKPVMAELLVRHVFGDTEMFERVCAQRGISVAEAVDQALKGWLGQRLFAVEQPQLPSLRAGSGLIPDPGDCPTGQEAHWIAVCEHDLEVLRRNQQLCFRSKDQQGLELTNQTIERYIQTLASLRERAA